MVQPALHTEVYDAIDPKNFKSQFNGKLLVITGAGRGIGQHIALAFAKAGANLALLDFDTERQSETKSLCEAEGAKVSLFGCDVTKYEQCAKTVEEIIKLGNINVLVNNAGGGPIRGFTSQKFEEFWAGVEQNFKGTMIMMHLILPLMKERKQGCIINIASRAGTITGPLAIHYYAGKAAVIRATGCIQAELDIQGFGDIHLYALHPGACRTGLQKPLDKDVAEDFPTVAAGFEEFQKSFKTSLDIPGQTCVYIASGKAKHALKGKYFDCEQDIQTVVDNASEIAKHDLYELKVDFLGGLPNDGGNSKM